MTPVDDRRRFSRVPFDANVELTNEQGRYETELVDISLNGVLVKRPDNLNPEPDEVMKIRIHGPEDAYTINMEAKIGHVEESILGFQCVSIDIDSATELRRLIELNLGESSLLNRELAELCHQE